MILLYSIIGIMIIGIIGLLWGQIVTDYLWHSYRAVHYLQYDVNATNQLNFFLSSKSNILLFISKVFESIYLTINGNFLMYPPENGGGYTSASNFITSILTLFMGCVYLAYPNDNKIKFKSKLVTLFVLCILYSGICFVQFLTWSPFGEIIVSGISPRYFLPFFILIPFIFGFNYVDKVNIEFDKVIMTLSISFMAIMVMSFVIGFY